MTTITDPHEYVARAMQKELDALATIPSKGTKRADSPLWGCLLRLASLAKAGGHTYHDTASRVKNVGMGRPIGDRLNDVERQFRNAWHKANPRPLPPTAVAPPLPPRRGSR